MTVKDVYAVIMAGGQGTRMWPLSRLDRPKQFLDLNGHGSLLQRAVCRMARLVSLERVMIVAEASQADMVREQVPDLLANNLVLEPVGRNTAACVGMAAWHIHYRDESAVMVVVPADHLFRDKDPFLGALEVAIQVARRGSYLVTLGIQPGFPATEYGYIRVGSRWGEIAGLDVYEALAFEEKPSRQRAEVMLIEGRHLWNSGTFAWKVTTILEALQKHMPSLYAGLAEIGKAIGTVDASRVESAIYSQLKATSIDYGVMEKAGNVLVVGAQFERIDVGTLASLGQLWPRDVANNAICGEAVCLNSRDNILASSDGLIALIGLNNVIVIAERGVILVCPCERAHEVRQLVTLLRAQGREMYL